MTRISLSFGALAPSISEQLTEQGFPLPEDIELLEQDVEALIRLRLRNVLTSSQAHRGEERVFKRLKRWLELDPRGRVGTHMQIRPPSTGGRGSHAADEEEPR